MTALLAFAAYWLASAAALVVLVCLVDLLRCPARHITDEEWALALPALTEAQRALNGGRS